MNNAGRKTSDQIAIYSRKSKFTGKGESIENQIELCRQYIRIHYGEEAMENLLIYEDEGFSGGNMERPRFKRMMQDARRSNGGKPMFSAIICYRLDRISRNIGDFANLIEELGTLKIAFISIKEQFDTSSPMGRAMMYIASVFSQLERETIAERIRDNMHELSKTGRWLGGTTPTGYASENIENVTIDGKLKKACKLQLIPEEAGLVRLIFRKFLETGSLTKTETYLFQNNYKTKNKKLFSRFAIKGILSNPVYMRADNDALRYLTEKRTALFADEADFDGEHGIMAYNRTLQRPGKTHEVREMSEWIVSVGKHKGLIIGEEWVKAQKLLAQNRSKSYRRPRSHTALLPGLLYCGGCGDYMRPKLSSCSLESHERGYSYLCTRKEKSRLSACSIKNANGNLLDRAVVAEIKNISMDQAVLIRALEQGKKKLMENSGAYDEEMERLKRSAEENEKEIGGLVSTLAKAAGTPSEAYIMKQIDELHEKGCMVNTRISEQKGRMIGHELSGTEINKLLYTLSHFENTIDNMEIEQKRAAIHTFVKKIVWNGEDVHIYFQGSEDAIDNK